MTATSADRATLESFRCASCATVHPFIPCVKPAQLIGSDYAPTVTIRYSTSGR